MSIKEKMGPLDELFLALFAFSIAVPAIGQSFGVDPRFLWMPVVTFALWTIYIGYYRGAWKFRDYPELGLVERMRGWSYFLNLIGTLTGNAILFFALSRQDVVYAFTGFFLASGFPVLVTLIIPRTVFERETALFNPSQRKIFIKVSNEVGSASITLSMSIVTTNFYVLSPNIVFPLNILIIFGVISQVLLLLRATIFEKQSRGLARNLAISLKESRWWQRYSYRQRRKRQ